MRLMVSAPRFSWQQAWWPAYDFDHREVQPALTRARRMEGVVAGKAQAIGLRQDSDIARSVLEEEVLATAAIEGERLDIAAVRSSVGRRLGLSDAGPRDRSVDGLVEVIEDATAAWDAALDHERLWRWQSALFPGGTSGIRRIAVGRYRDHEDPMQIVSGPPDREVVHYVAPASSAVPAEMGRFLDWFAATRPGAGSAGARMDGLARAAVAHLWFETIHPFEDGNGRIGRAIADMAIAQDHFGPVRMCSLSRQLLETRGAYYDALNAAQRVTSGDITGWVVWFVDQYTHACKHTSRAIDVAILRARFVAEHAGKDLNERQRKVVFRLLDAGDGGFAGGMNAEKYVRITGASKATATRDLARLLADGLLWSAGQGKATRYYINVPGWAHGVPGAGGS